MVAVMVFGIPAHDVPTLVRHRLAMGGAALPPNPPTRESLSEGVPERSHWIDSIDSSASVVN